MKPITKAIIPVAGFGTRFLPATIAQPKEMLPVVDKPVIQYIVEEAVASGITDIIFVTSSNKRALEDHFDVNPVLENRLEVKGKLDILEEVRKIRNLARFYYVRQTEQLGDGHAILQALPLLNGDPVAVLFGDDILETKVPFLKDLIEAYYQQQTSMLAVKEIEGPAISQYGVIDGQEVAEGGGQILKVNRVVEKPSLDKAPSKFGVIGRYILTPDALTYLKKQPPAARGEIGLAETFETMLQAGESISARKIDGLRFDCGSKVGFVEATLHYAWQRPEIRSEIKKYLETL